MERTYSVYILASKRNGTLYTGVTGDIARRVHLHKAGKGGAFTSKYGVHQLVHVKPFRRFTTPSHARRRLRNGRRAWKLQ